MIGWANEGCTVFPFDISPEEKPICMFGSIGQQGKFSYALESLGCEIADFSQTE